jgi:hypothetical protein
MGRYVKTPLFASFAIVVLASFSTAPAYASDEHLFDPVLSLEGACGGKDGALDPGCVGEPPTYPVGHAPKPFEASCGAAVDRHGDTYVANPEPTNTGWGANGRIDVFDPQGEFITEIPHDRGPCRLAVDSEGDLYVLLSNGGNVALYEPDSFPPTDATTYSLSKVFEFGEECLSLASISVGIAVDPSNDHLYVAHRCQVGEYSSAAEGSGLVDESVVDLTGGTGDPKGIDVYGENHDVYVPRSRIPGNPATLTVFDGSDGEEKCKIDGAETPQGEFQYFLSSSVAVDQANGDAYLYDTQRGLVSQFSVAGEECKYVGQLPSPPPLKPVYEELGDIAVDDPLEAGEAGYDSPNEGYVYVTSGEKATNSHLYAFKPKLIGPPEIEAQAASGIGEAEAVLGAELNPDGLQTSYHFEYTTEADFQANGYANAISVPVPDATAPKGGAFVPVSEPITGLQPGTAYRFRLLASNCSDPESEPGNCLTAGEGNPGGEGMGASFSTYPAPPLQSCPNAALRTGASASLPDCRAFELVTPPDTNGRIPTMAMLGEGFGNVRFDTTLASPDGESLIFGTDTGALPALGGGGFRDTYEARRDQEAGWQSSFTGLTGGQAEKPYPGGISPDHGYAFWSVESHSKGTLAAPPGAGDQLAYLHVPAGEVEPSPNCAPAAEPEGRFEWIGCGSLGFEPRTLGKWISPGGDHVIFMTTSLDSRAALQLEPCAASTGEATIYDRTPGGSTHCVSLLPDGEAAKSIAFGGASADGTAVAFGAEGTLYVRVDDAETLEVAAGSPTFGGISAAGDRVFYLEGGDVFVCDLTEGGCAGPEATHEPIQLDEGGESTLVNVSADGSHAYFVSKADLTPGEENEWGEEAEAGEENLYAWDGSAVRFIAIVEPLDVSGEFSSSAGATVGGLGLWVTNAVAADPSPTGGPANDPSRTTPDGSVLVFESHADLTGYDSGGHSEVYRFAAEAESGKRLSCLSCNPTGAAAKSDAQLHVDPSAQIPFVPFPPVSSINHIDNISADGRRVFFESGDRLVPQDLDGRVDVYEWEAQGEGGCDREAGCLSLISGGRSSEDDYLYAMSPDGHDVFFMSADTLEARDPDGTPSIYDARVDGGFPPPEPPPGDCFGEACQPAVAAPSDATPATSSHEGPGNPRPAARRSCPRGKRQVRQAGKSRCVKRHANKRHHQRSRNHRRAAR